MATKAKGASSSRKTSVSNGDYPLPPIFVASDSVHKQDWESVVGWIAACVLVVLLLPILGMLYMDVLQTKHEAQEQVQKVEKLRRQVEQKEREKDK
jgi:uncharacterized membrane protein YdfJ with MMPL/SSD domain